MFGLVQGDVGKDNAVLDWGLLCTVRLQGLQPANPFSEASLKPELSILESKDAKKPSNSSVKDNINNVIRTLIPLVLRGVLGIPVDDFNVQWQYCLLTFTFLRPVKKKMLASFWLRERWPLPFVHDNPYRNKFYVIRRKQFWLLVNLYAHTVSALIKTGFAQRLRRHMTNKNCILAADHDQ